MKNFQPQAPIMNESIPQPNQITEEKKVENPGTEEEPITVDPKTVDDDVDDIDLMWGSAYVTRRKIIFN